MSGVMFQDQSLGGHRGDVAGLLARALEGGRRHSARAAGRSGGGGCGDGRADGVGQGVALHVGMGHKLNLAFSAKIKGSHYLITSQFSGV